MKQTELKALFDRLGWKWMELTAEGGGRVLVLERGCRVIGVFADESSENAVWVRPELAGLASGEAVNDLEAHWNVGGDRTFISPEMEYFYDPSAGCFVFPPALDPGQYSADMDAHFTIMAKQSIRVRAFRAGKDVAINMYKEIRLVPDPLLPLKPAKGLGYSFVGYEVVCAAEIGGGSLFDLGETSDTASTTETASAYAYNAAATGVVEDEGALPPFSLWNLIQVPATGEAIMPTHGEADAVPFLLGQGMEGTRTEEGAVRFRIDGRIKRKISIRAAEAKDRIGYLRVAEDGTYYLLVRSFNMDRAGAYGDVPLDRPEESGHCVQCYNDDGTLGGFGEIEYHTPLMGPGQRKMTDISQVWCYSGDEEQIGKVATELLGVRL
ncbi:hypothetical protein Back11_19720 [Paenibacillus baekrokdamisoli]|uniref:Uncharacterized protein n=2 Tax=Paenibacillus baekrokdamisoli TaxID=1712516 RepID=A0A3G9IP40_9BACL|nr:hypothetical protein Back11_19720 [Paenibacillus baekrokdamisoli]